MPTCAVIRYLDLLDDLVRQRELAGGDLPDEDEDRYADQLDERWWAMTVPDQEEACARIGAGR